jgi:hypothetical protein
MTNKSVQKNNEEGDVDTKGVDHNCQNPNSTNNSIELNLRLDYILTARSSHHHKLFVVVVLPSY